MQAIQFPSSRSLWTALATATVVVAGLCATNAAHARSDVSWSVGIGAPGVAVGVTNGYGYPAPMYAPPAYVAAPVYGAYPGAVYAPPPVVYAPRPVYYAPRPVYYAPPPMVYGPQPRFYPRGDRDRDHRHGHGHGNGHR